MSKKYKIIGYSTLPEREKEDKVYKKCYYIAFTYENSNWIGEAANSMLCSSDVDENIIIDSIGKNVTFTYFFKNKKPVCIKSISIDD